MARKRVFLDEHIEPQLKRCFGAKAHIHTARDLGVCGNEDRRVIDAAVRRKCLIVTKNKDFVDYYRKHPLRTSGKVSFFYGLIYLMPSSVLSTEERLKKALRDVAWRETREHDDLITVYADGRTYHERLCHPECAAQFAATEVQFRPGRRVERFP
jgi:hypothetical protein